MICPKDLIKFLKNKKINFFTGVPDSLLKNFIENIPNKKKLHNGKRGPSSIAWNWVLFKNKKIPLIYFQNSGLGNTINPLISVANKNIYSIPMILLIGWRGEPGVKDEPQHKKQGKETLNFLKNLGIRYVILDSDSNFFRINKLIQLAKERSEPVAILAKKNIFKKNKLSLIKNNQSLIRSEVIEFILDSISKKTRIFSSTGYISRELDHILRQKKRKLIVFITLGAWVTLHQSLLDILSILEKKFCV